MNLSRVLPEYIAVDEVLLHRFAKIQAYVKLAILAFFTASVMLATAVTGHLYAVLGSGLATAAAVLGFFSARRAAALFRESDAAAARSAVRAQIARTDYLHGSPS